MLYLYPGMFKNFDDLEEHLTRDELVKMYTKAHEMKQDEQRFAAALQGIELGDSKEEEFERIKMRAEAKARGMDEEQYELNGLINIIEEDE